MKVSMIIALLALVPFVLAQEAAVEPEMDTSILDQIKNGITNLFGSEPVVTLKEKTQVVFDNLKTAHDQLNVFLSDLELDTIPYPEGTYSLDEAQNRMNVLSGQIQETVEGFVAKIEEFDIDSLRIETDPAPEGEAEAQPESDPLSIFNWW